MAQHGNEQIGNAGRAHFAESGELRAIGVIGSQIEKQDAATDYLALVDRLQRLCGGEFVRRHHHLRVAGLEFFHAAIENDATLVDEHYIGDEADIAHEPIALGPGVASENLQFSLIWGEAENRVERSGLSCAVGTDESKNAALFDTQIDAVEREGCAEGLAEAACFDDCHDFGSSGTFDGRRFAAPFSKSSAVRPSRSMVAETLGHSSARNFWRSPCSSRLRAPTL